MGRLHSTTTRTGEMNARNEVESSGEGHGMLTRRRFVSSGLAMGAGAVAGSVATFLAGCTHRVRGAGGGPTVTGQITGSQSLRAHAAEHGLFTGAAVAIPVLRSDPIYTRTLSE